MRIFAAQFVTETNTFAPSPTGWVSFREAGFYRGDASIKAPDSVFGVLADLRRQAEGEGHELVESIACYAQPGGRTVAAVYESIRDDILSDLQAALPLDAVVLKLHGAMATDGYDDCEGDLITRVRAIVGPTVPIGVELDLHCHTTAQMLVGADVIVAYKEYPHTDVFERMREVYRLTVDTALGKVKPTTAIYDCRMVGLWRTTAEPMLSFVQHMHDLEGEDGVLSVSFGHGFPWGDVAEGGAKVWVITDNDPGKAAQLAEQLSQRIWREREQTQIRDLTIDQGLDHALAAAKGPVVIADVADNPGGGAPSDSTFVLRRMIDRGVGDAVLGFFWDPGAVHICRDAGVGATLDLRIGGKCGPSSGDPVDLRVTVRAIIEDHYQRGLNLRWPLGPTVWVQGRDGLDIVLISVRSQAFDPQAFSDLGIDMAAKRLIVVKSTQHFHAGFAPIAAEVLYVAAPGAMSTDFGALPYKVRPLNYWPRLADPFAA